MKRATWLAGEAWRRKYGQLATTEAVDTSERVLYQLPNGTTGSLQDLVAQGEIDDPDIEEQLPPLVPSSDEAQSSDEARPLTDAVRAERTFRRERSWHLKERGY